MISINNLLKSGYDFLDNENLLQYRFKLLNSILFIGVIFSLEILITGALAFDTVNANTSVLFVYTFLNLSLIFFLRTDKKRYYLAIYIFLFISALDFSFATYYVDNDQLRVGWFFFLVLVSYLLAGKYVGLFSTIYSVTFILYVFENFDSHYNALSINTAITMIIIVAAIGFFYLRKIELDQIELNRLNGLLQDRVNEEVEKNISQAETFAQQRLNDSKFAIIGQMAAGITHEINTPLTYIKGNLEMIKDEIDNIQDNKIKNNLQLDTDKIVDGISRITSIINSMHEVSKKSDEQIKETNIYTTLITSLTILYNRSKLICDVDIQNSKFTLGQENNTYTFLAKVQPQRIEQVWIIIINNALDELQKLDSFEKRRLSIRIIENEDQLTVKFSDNGGGIDKKFISHIFDPLTSNKSEKGMGLGLSIAKQIVEEQNGSIIAYNEDDGAVFEVTFKKGK